MAVWLPLGALTGCSGADPVGGPGDVEAEAIESVGAHRAARPPRRLRMTRKRSRRCMAVRPAVMKWARKAGVDGHTMLAVAWVESGFSLQARSSVGAVGLMQLLPHISRAFGCDDPEHPACAARAAARLYRRLLDRFDGSDLYALCAYNAGAGRVRKAWRKGAAPFNKRYADKVFAARSRLLARGCTAD